MRRTVRRGAALAVLGVVGSLLAAYGMAGAKPAAPAGPPPGARQAEIAAAAREFGVPEPLLLALAGTLTGFGATADPAVDGGHGLLHLTDGPVRLSGRARAGAAAPAADPAAGTLRAAAALLGVPADRLRTDPATAARGAAALLRSYAGRPAALTGWYGAVARYATGDPMTGRAVADDVFALLRTGSPAVVVGGQRFSVPARPDAALPAGPRAPTDCPAALSCRFVPAAAVPVARAADARTIVLSDAPAGYSATVAAAQRPGAAWVPHFVVRARDGAVTQLLELADTAAQTANPSVDAGSVAIAVERGARPATVGALLRAVAARAGIPLDRGHVLGAGEVAGSPVGLDPAWDWAATLAAAGAPLTATAFRADRVAVVAAPGLVLRTGPADTAAALPRSPAVGRSLAVTGRQGEWTAVSYGGRTAWFRDPAGARTIGGDAVPVTPAPGLAGVPVYGAVAAAAPAPIGSAPAGQAYVPLDPAAVSAPTGSYLAISYGDTIGYVRADAITLTGLPG